MTEEQKECEYCSFGTIGYGHGSDFSTSVSDDTAFQVWKEPGGYYLNAWGRTPDGDKYDAESGYINYCPMCGRKLKEE